MTWAAHLGSPTWLCVFMCGYVRVCGGMCGYVRLCSVMCGYVRLCAVMCGYVGVCGGMCGYMWVNAAPEQRARLLIETAFLFVDERSPYNTTTAAARAGLSWDRNPNPKPRITSVCVCER